MMGYEVICLADRRDLMDKCVDLLNEQWPRSKTARLRSLEQCRPGTLPTSLALIDKSAGTELVVAHSKIVPVPHSTDACFVESVVVSKSLRGKGLGRLIMDGTEDFVKKMGITTVHLTTHDQQGFYEKLGYKLSEPITVFGGISPNLQKLMENNEKEVKCEYHGLNGQENSSIANLEHNKAKVPQISKPSGPPPPPPPGLPEIVRLNPEQLKKMYMKKSL